MKAFRKNSKVTAFVLTLALLLVTGFPVTSFAGVISGESDVNDVTINVILPTNLNFALDPLGLAVTGGNQISTQDYFFINQTLAPVKVTLDITATTSGDAVLLSSTGALAKDDTSETSKKLYFGALGATGLTGTAIAATGDAITTTSATDVITTYTAIGDIYGSGNPPAAEYATVSAVSPTMVPFTPNSDGSTGAAIISFALGKAVESATPGVISALASDDAGVAAFQFYSELNTYADWEANDITVSGTYTLTPLRVSTYDGYVAEDMITDSLNQLESAPPAPSTYSITVENDGNGTASADLSTATPGATVTLTATPSSGFEFDSWTSTPSSLTITSNTFTMPAENVTVKANFTAIPPDVTLTAGSPTASYSFSLPEKFGTTAPGLKIGVSGAAGTTITSATWGSGVDVKSYMTLADGVITFNAVEWAGNPTYAETLTIVADSKTYTITTLTGTQP